MAIRTNEQKVSNLVHTDSKLIESAMITASRLVDNVFSGCTVNADLLIEIETYIAAHFLLQNPAVRKETGQELVPYKEGLKNTPHGSQAIILDPTGKLNTLNRKRIYEFEAV